MRLARRPYRDEDDYWRIRTFLREVYLLNGRRERALQTFRFDYWRWHGAANITHVDLRDVVHLWEDHRGRLAAVITPEGDGDCFLNVHPNAASPGLLGEMLTVAEDRLAARAQDGTRHLTIWANEHDSLLRSLLPERGYTQDGRPEYQRRRSMDLPIPEPPLPEGCTVRALRDDGELPARCYLSGLAFHDDDITVAEANRRDVTWYRNVQNAPMYRRDLDLVAVAPDDALAAFCTIWFDDVTRTGAFEPVGTAPAYQRRGLARALLCEGLRRLARIGATMATVGSYGPGAGALYASVGFTDYELSHPWARSL